MFGFLVNLHNVRGMFVVCLIPIEYIIRARLLEWWGCEYDARYMLFVVYGA